MTRKNIADLLNFSNPNVSSHKKIFSFFDINLTRYAKIGQLNLTNENSYSFVKNLKFSNFAFKKSAKKNESGTVSANMAISYDNDTDSDTDSVKSAKVTTVRPGVLRVVEHIENRTER